MPESRFHFPSPPRWAFALVALLAFGFFLRVYVGICTPEHGITKFLRVGQEFDDRGTEVFRATPKFIDPYPAHRWGFDGQLYAEMALDPLLLDPHLHIALDNPPYRAQRILLSWIAWALGFAQPFWVINAYAALNLIFWIGFAFLAGRLFAPHGWAGLAGYAVTLVTCGVIESMQASLTDLPSFTLILAALILGGKAGAGILALAALIRSTSLIGLVGLGELPPPWREAIRRNIVYGVIAVVPLTLWVAYVLWRFHGREVNFDGGNLAMPFQGMMEKLGEFSVTALHGSIRWHRFFFELYKSYELHAVLTMVSVVTQIVFVALNRNWRDPLWRWGAVVAVYFICISFLSWESHFTVTRHALPITLLFNLLLAARPGRSWLIWFLLGNCFVPFGVRYFDGMREFRSPAPLREFAIEAPVAAGAARVQAQYGEGWSRQLWWPDSTWRWARRGRATIVLRNTGTDPVRVEFAFLARSARERELQIESGPNRVFSDRLPAARRVITVGGIDLAPGETTLTFTVTGDPARTDDEVPGEGTLKVENPQVRIVAP